LINAFPGYKQPSDFDALLNYIKKNEFDSMGFTQYKSSFTSAIPPLAKSSTRTSTARPTLKQPTAQKPTFQKRITVKPGQNNNNIGIQSMQKSAKAVKPKPKTGN